MNFVSKNFKFGKRVFQNRIDIATSCPELSDTMTNSNSQLASP